jgi:hypothetical protein
VIDASKVYDEPDTAQPSVVTLSKDLVVTRLATLGSEWTLVDFPSGVGKVSPGWIESKSLAGGGGVPSSAASAKLATSAKPATSATPSAAASGKAAAAAVASVTPAVTASAPVKPKIKPGILRPPPH